MINLDIISSKVNLTHANSSRHASYIGVILSSIVISISVAFAGYSSVELFQRNQPISNSYVKFQDNAGEFFLNQQRASSSWGLNLENKKGGEANQSPSR